MSDSSSTVQASSGFLQILPSAISVAATTSGLGCSYSPEERATLSAAQQGTGEQKRCPRLCAGRGFYQAEPVHCPFSVGTNGPVLSLGKSISNPQTGRVSNACRAAPQPGKESIPSLINGLTTADKTTT